jgi:hypothetical protein
MPTPGCTPSCRVPWKKAKHPRHIHNPLILPTPTTHGPLRHKTRPPANDPQNEKDTNRPRPPPRRGHNEPVPDEVQGLARLLHRVQHLQPRLEYFTRHSQMLQDTQAHRRIVVKPICNLARVVGPNQPLLCTSQVIKHGGHVLRPTMHEPIQHGPSASPHFSVYSRS